MTKDNFITSVGLDLAMSVHAPLDSSSITTCAILCPGYVDSKDYAHMVALGDALAAVGILAIRFDPVGVWASGGSEKDYSVSHTLENIADIRAWAEANYGVKSVIVAGHSLGGFISMLYAGQAPTTAVKGVSGVIAICPPKEVHGTINPRWEKNGIRHSVRDVPGSGSGPQKPKTRSFDMPWSFAVDSSQYSALNTVKHYKNTPLLLIAGSEDTVIPPTEVQDIYDCAHPPKKITILEGLVHNYREVPQDIKRVNHEIINWIESLGV